MRNYLVPPGTCVVTPEIIRVSDGKVIRSSNSLVSGPCSLDMRMSKWAISALRCLAVNVAAVVFNATLLNNVLSALNIAAILLSSLVVGLLIYNLCFIFGRKRLQQLTQDICHGKNNFYYASLEQGSKTSQPSKLHKYWIMCHAIPPGHEVAVRVKINPYLQKYWSLVVYDPFGLPLPQYVYDDNAFKTDDVGLQKSAAEENVYHVDIRLRNGGSVGGGASLGSEVDANVVDVSASPVGYVLFRVNHPVDESVVDFSAPFAKLETLSATSAFKKNA